MSLNSMAPTGDKSLWENKANMIVALGYPAVADNLPELLHWLQDMNWPGSRTISEFLVSIGTPLVPYILEILNGNDEDWIYWILIELVSKWDSGTVAPLEPALMRFAQFPYHADDLDLIALRLLAKNKLGNLDTLKQQVESKKQSMEYRIRELAEVERCWAK